jgi:hypothetical protein
MESKSSQWDMPFEVLAERLLKREATGATREEIEELVSRAILRSGTVMKYLGLTPAQPMMTARQWETRWNPKAAWQIVEKSLARLGWRIKVERDERLSPLAVAGAHAGARENVLLLDPSAAEARAAQHRRTMNPNPINEQGAVVLAATEELFRLAVEKMGNLPPDSRVDELAEAHFVQDLHGLPFSVLAERLT